MNSEYDLFPGTRPIYPASAKGFDPLKAQFRRAEIYKRALEMFVEDHNNWVIDVYGPEVACDLYDIDVYINNAKIEIDNGK